MRIYKTRWLAKFARREKLTGSALIDAIERAERGLIDADLGHGLIKQRVARRGQGRSGGYRMLVAYRAGDRAVFVFGFAKNERENLAPDDLLTVRDVALIWLAADDARIEQAVEADELSEVFDEA